MLSCKYILNMNIVTLNLNYITKDYEWFELQWKRNKHEESFCVKELVDLISDTKHRCLWWYSITFFYGLIHKFCEISHIQDILTKKKLLLSNLMNCKNGIRVKIM